MCMIKGLNQQPPFNLRVELAVTEEEGLKRKIEREKDKRYQQEVSY